MRTPAQDDADYGEDAHLSVRVSVHLSERTTAEIHTYPDEGRATIGLTGYRQSVGVILFVTARDPEGTFCNMRCVNEAISAFFKLFSKKTLHFAANDAAFRMPKNQTLAIVFVDGKQI